MTPSPSPIKHVRSRSWALRNIALSSALCAILLTALAALVFVSLPIAPTLAATSDIQFEDSGQILGTSKSYDVELGDLDGDGDLDAFVANYKQADRIYGNDIYNAEFFDSGQDLGTSASHGAALGDVDGDGDLDVFVANYLQANGVYTNDGSGVFSDSGQALGAFGSQEVALGDLNGDGDLDAFVAVNGDNRVWTNNGSGVFSDSGQTLGSSNSFNVALGDLDGDGDLDAFIANYQSANRVWTNDGSGTFSDSGQSLGTDDTLSVALGDLDGDGDLDAFTAETNGQADRVYTNNGSGTFNNSGQTLGSTDSRGVDLGDLDGDGDLDAFIAVSGGNRVYTNNGNGTFNDSGLSLGSSESFEVELADMDGDGDLDAWIANYSDQANTVWFNTSGHTLAVRIEGSGGGTISSNPAGIDCGADCNELYDPGTQVTLTATADLFSLFIGWSGDCADSNVLTMDGARSCSAWFANTSAIGPYFTSAPVTEADEDAPYTYSVSTDHSVPGTPVTLTAPIDELPGWLTFEDLGGGTGTLSGTPAQTDVGENSVTLVVEDDGGLSETQSFTITVSNVNDAPRFESYATRNLVSNISYTYAITSTDEDGDALTLTAPIVPAWLTFTDEGNGGGTLEGTPTFAEIGEHPVLLKLEDTLGATAEQAFTLTVANEPPFPLQDTYTVLEDSANNVFEVLDNDTDNPDPISLTAVDAADHGTATQSGDTILYTPSADYFGPDYIRYTVSDGLDSTDAMVMVTVEAVNDHPPQPQDDPITVYEDAGVHQIWVLNNDVEPEGDPLSITAVSAASHGTVSVEHPVTGTLLYTPTADYHGPDTFTYTVSDGLFEVDANVNVTVNPINDPPVATPDNFDVAEDSSGNPLTVLANDTDGDGDTLTLTGVGKPAHGNAYFGPGNDDGLTAQSISAFTVITYTPDLNFVGTDTFTYTVSDGTMDVGSVVTVSVQAGANDRPEAWNDFFTVAGDAVDATFDVLGNDSDPEGDALSVSLFTPPTNGSAAAAPDGLSLLYTPNPGFSDYDSLAYKLTDGSWSITATVRIRVLPVNKAPTAFFDTFTVDADTTGNALMVLENDTDPDGDRLLISTVGTPVQAGAFVELNPLHTALLYTPPPGISGSDTFTYTLSDGVERATATVNVSINADTTTADLSLSRSVLPASVNAGEAQAVTALYTISNAGPAQATGLELTDTWSKAPASIHVLEGGACSGTAPIVCSLNDLPAGESVQLHLNLSFSPDAALTAMAQVSTTKTDPNTGNNTASAAVAVSGPRETRTLGSLTITADGFTDLGGGVTRAQGNLGIGRHFYMPDANGSQATLDFDADGIVAASGELRLRQGDYALFDGSFTASAKTGLGAPTAGVSYTPLSEVAGFSVSGGASVTQLDFRQGVATGYAELAYAGGDAVATIPLDFEVRPGPHFSGDASAAFAVLYGDGSVLSLGAENATLARLSNEYELLATGVVTYNLTHPFDENLAFTPDMPGVYEAVPGVAFALKGDGSLRRQQSGLDHLTVLIDYLNVDFDPLILDNQGLATPLAALRFDASLGGSALYWENVRISQDGLSLVGLILSLPDIVPEDALFSIRNVVATVAEAEAGYTLADFSGDLVLDMAQNHKTIENFNLGPDALKPAGAVAAQDTAPAATTDVNKGLTAHFPFDEMYLSNDFENKASGYPNCNLWDDLTLPSLSEGWNGKAVYFDGNDLLATWKRDLSSWCGLDLRENTGQGTIAFWVKSPPVDSSKVLVSNWNGGRGFNITIEPNGWKLWWDNGDSTDSLHSYTQIDDNRWHHIGVTFQHFFPDPDLPEKRMIISSWVDTYQGFYPYSPFWPSGAHLESGNGLFVGSDASKNQKFSGWIDDLRLYNIPISYEQRQELQRLNPPVPVNVASANFEFVDGSVEFNCIEATSMIWNMPDILGGGSHTIDTPYSICGNNETTIDTRGLADLEFGSGSNKAEFDVSKATIKKSGDELILTLTGKIGMSVGGQSVTIEGDLILNSNNKVSGHIETFEFDIIGFNAKAEKPKIEDGTFTAETVSLGFTSPWPDTMPSGEMRNVTFTPPRDFELTGFTVEIPALEFGKFQLPSAKATFDCDTEKVDGETKCKDPDDPDDPGKWTIALDASLTIPKAAQGEDVEIEAGVVLISNKLGAVQALYAIPYDPENGALMAADASGRPLVIPLDPALLHQQVHASGEQTLAPDAKKNHVDLEKVSLSLKALYHIGNGVYLNEVSGGVDLHPDSDALEIEIGVGLQYGKEIDGLDKALLTAALKVYLGIEIPYYKVRGETTFDFERLSTREVMDEYGNLDNFRLPLKYTSTQPLDVPKPHNRLRRADEVDEDIVMYEETHGKKRLHGSLQGVSFEGTIDTYLHAHSNGNITIDNTRGDWDSGDAKVVFRNAGQSIRQEFDHPKYPKDDDSTSEISQKFSNRVPLPKLETNPFLMGGSVFMTSQDCDRFNVAYGKRATQSSTYDDRWIAGNAVDGSMHIESDTFTKEIDDHYSYWEVDLGKAYDIDEIKIWRPNDRPSLMDDIWIQISDRPFIYGPTTNPEVGRNYLNRSKHLKEWPGTTQAIAFGEPIREYDTTYTWTGVGAKGRYIRIQAGGKDRHLQLNEVAIYAKERAKGNAFQWGALPECTVPCGPTRYPDNDSWEAKVESPLGDVCVLDWYSVGRTDRYEIQTWVSPVKIGFSGEAKLLDTWPFLNTGVGLDSLLGMDAYMKAKSTPMAAFEFKDVGANLNAWLEGVYPGTTCSSNCFNMTGDIGFDFELSLKTITRKKVKVSKPKVKLEVGSEFGRFDYNGNHDKPYWGTKLRTYFDIPDAIDWFPGVPDKVKVQASAMYGNNKLNFDWGGNVKSYSLVQRPTVVQALMARDQLAALKASSVTANTLAYAPLNVNPALHFPAGSEDVIVDVQVGYDTTATALLQTANDAITMSVTAPDGTVYEPVEGPQPGGVTLNSYTLPQPVGGVSQRAQLGQAGIRAVHAVDGAPNLDLWADNGTETLIFSSLTFSDTTTYSGLGPGAYTLRFKEAGTATTLAETHVTLAAGEDLTLLAAGAPGALYAWAVPDNNAPRGDDDAYLRVIHAAPGIANLSVGQALGSEFFPDVGYGMASDYQGLLAQSYDFEFIDNASGDWLMTSGWLSMDPGTHTLLLLQSAGGELLPKLVQDVETLAQVRFLQAASGRGTVDLTVAGQPLHSGVAPLTLTANGSLAFGEQEVAVMQGASPLVTATVPFTYGLDYTLALVDEAGVAALKVFTDSNDAALLQDTGQLRLIHAAPGAPAVQARAAGAMTVSLTSNLSYGETGGYQVADSGPYTITVQEAGTTTVLLTDTDVPVTEGSATLFLVDDGIGGLQLLHGQDAAVSWLRTDLLTIENAQVGQWQVTLHNARNAEDDYKLEVSGEMPETTLSDVDLAVAPAQATLSWALNSFEPDAKVELRLGVLSNVPSLPPQETETITSNSIITLSSGITETVPVTSTLSSKSEPLTYRTLAALRKPEDPSWIDGTPQSYTFDYTDLPNGVYELQVRVDDYANPIVSEVISTTFSVDHPWPASWPANLRVGENNYRDMVLAWDPLEDPNLDSYELIIEEPAEDSMQVYYLDSTVISYTVISILPGRDYTISLRGFDFQTGEYSEGGSIDLTSAVADFTITQMTPLPAFDVAATGDKVTAGVEISVTTDLEDYPGSVHLMYDGFSDGLSLGVEPNVITPTIQGVTTTVWITASEFMASGTYTASVRGAGGGTAHVLEFAPSVIAADFNLNASANALNLDSAGAELILSATGINGHDKPIQLDVIGLPAGIEATFDNDLIKAGEHSILRLTTTPLTTSGVHTLTLRGDDGPNRHELELTLTVAVPDFVVTVQPDSLAAQRTAASPENTPNERMVYPTQNATFTLDVDLLGGWDHPVTLHLAPDYAPSGGGLGLNRAGLSAQDGPAATHSITLDGDGTVELTVGTSATTPAGLYLLPLQAESAGVRKTVELKVKVLPALIQGLDAIQPWTLISFHLNPLDEALDKVLLAIDGHYDKVLSETGIFDASVDPSFNTLSTLQPGQAYWLRTLEDVDLTVLGLPLDPSTPLALHAGWNWVGYLPIYPLAVTDALASIEGQYLRVSGDVGVYDVLLPPDFNTLQDMQEGDGYLIYMSEAGTLVYPGASAAAQRAERSTPAHLASCPALPGTPFYTEVWGYAEGRLPVGAVVTAHNPRNDVVGCYTVQKAGQFGAMRIYGEDASAQPSIPGMREGEAIAIRVDGEPAVLAQPLLWQNDRTPHQATLIIGSIPTPEPGENQLWLPQMWR